MVDLVESVLQKTGPALSTEVAKVLVTTHGLSAVAARQRVFRRTNNVHRLGYIKFPRNARFLYLTKDFGSPTYWEHLIRALLDTNSAYGLALASFQQRNGIMPVSHFAGACGSPIRQLKHIPPETIIKRLLQANLVGEYDVPGLGPCYGLREGPDRYDDGEHLVRARLIAEDILLKALKSWAQRLGLVSYDRVAIRGEGELPKVGTFAWDMTAPSYLGPMRGVTLGGAIKPGVLVCDVLLGTQVSEVGIQPFLNKCATLRSLHGIGRCLQIFLADHFSPKAFDLAKRAGIVPATPEVLFGREIATGLGMIFDTLRDAAGFGVSVQQISDLFDQLKDIEGAALNLRGALFEYLVAEIGRKTLSTDVQLRRIFKDEGGSKAEADVVIEQSNRAVTFIECKGYRPSGSISDDDVRRWLQHTIPTIYGAARMHSDWKNLEINFEFWTSGQLSHDGRELILKAKRSVRQTRYRINLYEAEEVKEAARRTGDKSLLRTLEDHFLDHPLSRRHSKKIRRVARPRSVARKDADLPKIEDREFELLTGEHMISQPQ
jgi:hypothetical protein